MTQHFLQAKHYEGYAIRNAQSEVLRTQALSQRERTAREVSGTNRGRDWKLPDLRKDE